MITLNASSYDKVYWISKKWSCSYCSLVHYDYNRMVDHESKCDLNPENKNCLTCDLHCNIQPAGGYGCRAWKNVKFERTKKLKIMN